MDRLAGMRVFVRVVESGSFSAAARETGATQSKISKQVAALEDHLGCLLMQRTTRSLTLTEDGRSFYDLSLRALDAGQWQKRKALSVASAAGPRGVCGWPARGCSGGYMLSRGWRLSWRAIPTSKLI